MSIDIAIVAAVVALSALILNFKSHVKYVALGVFVGLVLLELVPMGVYVVDPVAESFANVALVMIPALVLGVNHTVDKRKEKIPWTAVFVLVFTLFFLSSLAQLLPLQYQTMIQEQSVIGWQVLSLHLWYTVAAATLILVDSIRHRHHAEKEKKKKKKSKS